MASSDDPAVLVLVEPRPTCRSAPVAKAAWRMLRRSDRRRDKKHALRPSAVTGLGRAVVLVSPPRPPSLSPAGRFSALRAEGGDGGMSAPTRCGLGKRPRPSFGRTGVGGSCDQPGHDDQILVAVAFASRTRTRAHRLGQIFTAVRALAWVAARPVPRSRRSAARLPGAPCAPARPERPSAVRPTAMRRAHRGHPLTTRPFFTARAPVQRPWHLSVLSVARCTATVLTLSPSTTAISLFDLPCAMSCSTCFSRSVR